MLPASCNAEVNLVAFALEKHASVGAYILLSSVSSFEVSSSYSVVNVTKKALEAGLSGAAEVASKDGMIERSSIVQHLLIGEDICR